MALAKENARSFRTHNLHLATLNFFLYFAGWEIDKSTKTAWIYLLDCRFLLLSVVVSQKYIYVEWEEAKKMEIKVVRGKKRVNLKVERWLTSMKSFIWRGRKRVLLYKVASNFRGQSRIFVESLRKQKCNETRK